MVKRIPSPLFFLVCLVVFGGCEKEECFFEEEEKMSPSAMLTEGVWDLQWIKMSDVEDGVAQNSRTEPYGPNTDNGICTFDFSGDYTVVMVDVEGENEEEYVYFRNGNVLIGDQLYLVETLEEDVLELVAFFDGHCGDDDEERTEGEEEHMYFTR